jgi:uncharacterized protein
MTALLFYLAAGLAAGIVSGLFGMGGGLAMVPLLVVALALDGVPQVFLMHVAVGTSLSVIIVTSLYTIWLRWRHSGPNFELLGKLWMPVAFGAGAGAVIGDYLPGQVMRWFFMAFLVFMIGRLIRRMLALYSAAKPENGASSGAAVQQSLRLPEAWGYGTVAGIFGALLGIGVAAIMTPVLSHKGYRMGQAAEVAVGLAVIVGIFAGAGYLIGGLNEVGIPEPRAGYIYLPAFGGMAVGALAGSPIGIRLSRNLPELLQLGLFIAYAIAMLITMATR